VKSIEEILTMLVHELEKYGHKIDRNSRKNEYYNEQLGDTSFLLAGLLELLLKENITEWDKEKWIDDSLITKIEINNDKLTIEGIMIWGIENTTEQWTDPFCFEIESFISKIDFKKITFLFGDWDYPEVSYEEFKKHRNFWGANDRNWKYIINSNIRVK